MKKLFIVLCVLAMALLAVPAAASVGADLKGAKA